MSGCRDNDAHAAAWAEYGMRHQQIKDLLFITLSTGVGGGLVLDGRLRTGCHGLAGHVGHMALDRPPLDATTISPIVCACGRPGCLETVASGSALTRQAQVAFGREVKSEEPFDMARQGTAAAEAILTNAAHAVASAIASCHAQLDLQCVVLGGSVGLAPGMLARVQQSLGQLPAIFQVPVEVARLGADAGLVGAQAWAEHLETH